MYADEAAGSWSSPPTTTGRSLELRMPSVTVLARPSGEPIAITVSPTWMASESPSSIGTSFSEARTWITARS
jgi:hypothetical protein